MGQSSIQIDVYYSIIQFMHSAHLYTYVSYMCIHVTVSLQMHGEDSVSYERNAALLVKQYMKNEPSPGVIKSLMELTAWKRRTDIEEGDEHISVVLDKYPFLGEKQFVS